MKIKERKASVGRRIIAVEWCVDPPRAIEVRVRRRAGDLSAWERIRYVKLALGILNHRLLGSIAGLYRSRRARSLDG